MTSKEILENLKKGLIFDLQESKADYNHDEEADDIAQTDGFIIRVDHAMTFGEVAEVMCDAAYDVHSWTIKLIVAASGCTDSDGLRQLIGDIPDHWST